MSAISSLKKYYQNIKSRLRDNTFDNIVWIVNIVPSVAGFSIRRNKIAVLFWIIHLSLLLYVYGVGVLVFQLKIAEGVKDIVASYVNVSLMVLIFNMSWWWISKRPLLIETLQLIEDSDIEARKMESLREKHTKMLSKIKLIILLFYICNYVDASFIYLPYRVDVSNEFSMATCVGLEPLTSSPNREICLIILFAQECSIMIAVLNYQALLLFLISHTAVMYNMLANELTTFNDFSDLKANKAKVKEILPSLIRRHAAILSTVENLKSLYSLPLGVDFGANAVCIALFFYIPLQEMLKYIPVLVYCFLSFFLYCFLCQRVTSASEVFERAVYGCGWENFDVKEKKLVYVMLRQAQKPVILLAANIIPVNMYTFATTLQNMFKFITVVKF